MPTPSDGALCRGVLWEALALGFRPPGPEVAARLAAAEAVDALADAAAVLDTEDREALAAHARPGPAGPGPASIPAEGPPPLPLTEAVRRLARPVAVETLRADYQALFGHTARGAVPPYETEYGADSLFQPMHEMADLAAFYRAFGLALRRDARERPDHVACECEFLAFLARKEAYALEQGEASMLEATRQATRRFLRDHLGRWGPGFGRTLARRDPDGFYGALGLLAAAVVTRECARAGVAAGPDLLRLRAVDLSQAPAACGEAAPAGAPGPALP
jgi:TorA maturation chaperone TorD